MSIPSLSSQEGAVVECMAEEMKKLGYDEVTVDPMGNLIGRIGNGPVKIALDGHCDTVDVGNRVAVEDASRSRPSSRTAFSTAAARATRRAAWRPRSTPRPC